MSPSEASEGATARQQPQRRQPRQRQMRRRRMPVARPPRGACVCKVRCGAVGQARAGSSALRAVLLAFQRPMSRRDAPAPLSRRCSRAAKSLTSPEARSEEERTAAALGIRHVVPEGRRARSQIESRCHAVCAIPARESRNAKRLRYCRTRLFCLKLSSVCLQHGAHWRYAHALSRNMSARICTSQPSRRCRFVPLRRAMPEICALCWRTAAPRARRCRFCKFFMSLGRQRFQPVCSACRQTRRSRARWERSSSAQHCRGGERRDAAQQKPRRCPRRQRPVRARRCAGACKPHRKMPRATSTAAASPVLFRRRAAAKFQPAVHGMEMARS